jgi:hypothetical protein
MKLCFAAMLGAMFLVFMLRSDTRKVSGLGIIQSGNILWPERYGVKSATQRRCFQSCLIIDFSQPISFGARFGHHTPLERFYPTAAPLNS